MARPASPQIVDVAERILNDIRERKLQPGDAYLGTAATARKLRISGSTVNRAFQLLARRGIVERRQRRGTIILDPARLGPPALRKVHLLVREDHLRAEGLWADGVLLGLQRALPGVELEFNFRPEVDEAEYVQTLIADVLRSRLLAGLVLIRSNVLVQRLVAASGLPAVISGTRHPSIHGLPSLDRDQQQIGELLAGHLLKSRVKRFLILMRDRMLAGDHLMLDRALKTLAAGEISLEQITLRFLPSDSEAIVAELKGLLSDGQHSAACLCRSERIAKGVDAAADQLRLSKRERPLIVVADTARQHSGGDPYSYPCIEADVVAEQWGAQLGELLLQSTHGRDEEPPQKIIPVHLWTPESRA